MRLTHQTRKKYWKTVTISYFILYCLITFYTNFKCLWLFFMTINIFIYLLKKDCLNQENVSLTVIITMSTFSFQHYLYLQIYYYNINFNIKYDFVLKNQQMVQNYWDDQILHNNVIFILNLYIISFLSFLNSIYFFYKFFPRRHFLKQLHECLTIKNICSTT